MPEQMSIFEIEPFGSGGLAHYVDNLARALAERGHRVTVVTARSHELVGRTPLPPNLRVARVLARLTPRTAKLLPAPMQSLARKLEAIFDAVVVSLLAARSRPDVIHLHSTNPAALLYLVLLRLTRRPLVSTAHVVTPHEPIPLQRLVYGLVHRLPRLVVAHSAFDRRRLVDELSVDPARIVVIPHGEYGFFERCGGRPDRATARRDLDLEPEAEVALFFGYLREYKGLDLLLDAWPAVTERRPDARLVVAGDPVRLPAERRRELEAWATRVGARHRFEYVPFAEVTRYFSAADVLVMPYRSVSQSGILYLGLALGLPVLASRIGPWEELLSDGENARLVPPESPAALAEALVEMLGDRGARERLAQGGRALAARHSWPAIAEQSEVALRTLVCGARAR